MAMPDLQRYPEKLCLLKYKIYISVICFCKFYLWVLCESDMRISCKKEAMEKLAEVNTFRVRKTTVSFDQIKVSMVSLYIGHCHLFMEVHLKLRIQSL